MTSYRSFFSSQLVLAREGAGLSLSQAANRVGMTKAHLHDLESGRSGNPTARTIYRLAKALRVRGQDLLSALFLDYGQPSEGTEAAATVEPVTSAPENTSEQQP